MLSAQCSYQANETTPESEIEVEWKYTQQNRVENFYGEPALNTWRSTERQTE